MAKNLGYTRIWIPGLSHILNRPVVIQVGGKNLDDILEAIESGSARRLVVTDITNIDGNAIEALRAGDMVIKRDSTGDHSYRVSFRCATGICLTYSDCENVETVAYDKVEGVWTYDSTDVTHIGS